MKYKFQRVLITGGEPLLHKDIHLMAEFAHNLKMQTSITTNTLLYSKYAEKLAGKINLPRSSMQYAVGRMLTMVY